MGSLLSTAKGDDKEPSDAKSTANGTIAAKEAIPIECSICYEEMNIYDESVATLPCNHQFHKQCVGTWMLGVRQTTCPMCRLKVPPKVRTVLRRDAPKPPPKKQAKK